MIKPVSALPSRVIFRGTTPNVNDNPINKKMEARLAILNAAGISSAMGAVTTIVARSYTANWKHAGIFGLSAAAITMLFVCPRFLYKSGINSYTKEKEMDVFTKEKEVQKKLLTDVREAIDNNPEVLQEKLDNYSKTK